MHSNVVSLSFRRGSISPVDAAAKALRHFDSVAWSEAIRSCDERQWWDIMDLAGNIDSATRAMSAPYGDWRNISASWRLLGTLLDRGPDEAHLRRLCRSNRGFGDIARCAAAGQPVHDGVLFPLSDPEKAVVARVVVPEEYRFIPWEYADSHPEESGGAATSANESGSFSSCRILLFSEEPRRLRRAWTGRDPGPFWP